MDGMSEAVQGCVGMPGRPQADCMTDLTIAMLIGQDIVPNVRNRGIDHEAEIEHGVRLDRRDMPWDVPSA